MKKHEKALDRFMEQIGEINERLAELKELANDHMGFNPDDIDWGHVGTAGFYLEKLTEMTDHAFKRGEYAEEGGAGR
jgi:hypothetical protein